MALNIEELAVFSQAIQSDLLGDPEKDDWKDKDYWWYLSKLASDVNALERALVSNTTTEITEKTVSIAAFVFILHELANQKKPKKKGAKK